MKQIGVVVEYKGNKYERVDSCWHKKWPFHDITNEEWAELEAAYLKMKIEECDALTAQLATEKRAVERLIDGILSLNNDCPPCDCPEGMKCREIGKNNCWRDYAYRDDAEKGDEG